jgi:hypothetical protein
LFEEDGRRDHPIINPQTGEPAEGILPVTVIGPDGTRREIVAPASGRLDSDERGERRVGCRCPAEKPSVVAAAPEVCGDLESAPGGQDLLSPRPTCGSEAIVVPRRIGPSGAFLYRMPGYSSSFVTGVAVHETPRHIPGRGRKDDAMSWLSVIDRYSVS